MKNKEKLRQSGLGGWVAMEEKREEESEAEFRAGFNSHDPREGAVLLKSGYFTPGHFYTCYLLWRKLSGMALRVCVCCWFCFSPSCLSVRTG